VCTVGGEGGWERGRNRSGREREGERFNIKNNEAAKEEESNKILPGVN